MNHRLEGKYRTNGLSLSMEYGKRMKKENGFYIDPSIELTAGHLGGKDYDAVSDYAGGKKMHIHQDGINSVIGRIGLGIGKETERSNLFAKIALAHEFGGKVKSIFSAENEPTSGTEVDLKDSWVDIEDGELLVKGMHISPYDHGNMFNQDPMRVRRLLAHKSEIRRLHQQCKLQGYTLVPLSLYFKHGRVKMEVGLCKGKKLYDKRADAAQRDAKRSIDRAMKSNGKYY